MTKVTFSMVQVLKNVNDDPDLGNSYKNVLKDGLETVLKGKFPQLTTSFANQKSPNYLEVKITDLIPYTPLPRRLGSSHHRQLGGGTCSSIKCKVSYKITLVAEIINTSGFVSGGDKAAAAAQTLIASTINDAIGDLSLQTALKTSSFSGNQFDKIEAQQQVAFATPPYTFVSVRTVGPTAAPSLPPAPAPPPFVSTSGGVATLVILLGGFLVLLFGGGAWYLNEKRKKKVSKRLRLESLDKWNKLPRNVNADKEPEFINIYGGYSGFGAEEGKDEEEDEGDEAGRGEWKAVRSKDNQRVYWMNKSTLKTTFRKPLSRGGRIQGHSSTSQFDGGAEGEGDEDEDYSGADDKQGRDLSDRYGPSGLFGKSHSGIGFTASANRRKAPSVPVRVRAVLEAQRKYSNGSGGGKATGAISGSEHFSPPRDLVKDAAKVPDINLWFERYSNRHAKVYWKHQVTNEVSWKPPAELDYYTDKVKARKSPKRAGEQQRAGPESPPLPSHLDSANPTTPGSPEDAALWTPKQSKKWGLTYYKHELTGEIRWEPPEVQITAPPEEERPSPEVWVQKFSAKHGLHYFKRQVDGLVSWEEPVGPVQIIPSAVKRQRTTTPKVKTKLDIFDGGP